MALDDVLSDRAQVCFHHVLRVSFALKVVKLRERRKIVSVLGVYRLGFSRVLRGGVWDKRFVWSR